MTVTEVRMQSSIVFCRIYTMTLYSTIRPGWFFLIYIYIYIYLNLCSYYYCYLSPCRHRHQWQVAWQLKHSSIDKNAEDIRARRPLHPQNGRHECHLLGNATFWSGQDDAGDTPANLFDPGVWHVWEWCDVRHFVRHQHVISSCYEVELS